MKSCFLPILALLSVCAAAAEAPMREYPVAPLPDEIEVNPGPIQANWESMIRQYHCPDWFRDAKFGIWAHWSAQCVPEQGDWYARSMYIQGNKDNVYHVQHYGPPSQFGFMEIDHLWKAERWNPERLMDLYVKAGAHFFVALANHEDNFDTYDSKYFAWNAMNVGPHRDIIGTWEKVARAHGLRFGVSNHSSHAWHWFQPAYGYDAEGPLAGVRYDAYRLTKADGRGKWWEGLDPQDLYVGPTIVAPVGMTSAKTEQRWHDANDLPWTEEAPKYNPRFARLWYYRLKDLVDKYDPDFLYLDNTGFPFGQIGLDAAANFYNGNIARHGKLDAVLTSKGLRGDRQKAVVQDFERNRPGDGIHPEPFEMDTCIGEWHYHRGIQYKTVGTVVRMLVDVVSRNGTMLLSIPMRGDGTIDDAELAFLHGLANWMSVNGVGIFGTRPWKTFGEGPTQIPRGRPGDLPQPFTAQDIRFTASKDGALYVWVMAAPAGPLTVKALGRSSPYAQAIRSVALVGSDDAVHWKQGADGLSIDAPQRLPSSDVFAYKVEFQ